MTVAVEAQPRNVARLAMELAVSRQTLYTWEKEGCPLVEGVEAVREWRSIHKSHESSTLKQQQEMARLRKWEADARAIELDNMEREGMLVPRDEVVAEFAEILIHAKALIESMVDEVCKEVPQMLRVTVRTIVREAVDRFFRKLSQWRPGA